MPPATKDADRVELKEGTLILDPATASELSVPLEGSKAYTPVHVSGPDTVPADKVQSSTLAVQLNQSQTLSLTSGTFIVVYDIFFGDGRQIGMITPVTRNPDDLRVSFLIRGFGNYQVVELPTGTPEPQGTPFQRAGKPLSKAEAAALDPWVLNSLRPDPAYEEDTITVTGVHFRESLSAAYDGKAFPITIRSPNEAQLRLKNVTRGTRDLHLSQDGITKSIPLTYGGKKTDPPVLDKKVEDVCQGESFYDPKGELKKGAKDCSKAEAASGKAPVATISSPLDPGPTDLAVIPVDIIFDQEVTGFTESDLSLSSGAFDQFSGSGKTFQVTIINPIDPLSVTLDANKVESLTGMGNQAASWSISLRPIPPTVSI